MRIRVEGYAGLADGPRCFVLGERTIEVEDCLDRWYGAEADYYRVLGKDGDLYVLKRPRGEGGWELIGFTRRGSSGTSIHMLTPHVMH